MARIKRFVNFSGRTFRLNLASWATQILTLIRKYASVSDSDSEQLVFVHFPQLCLYRQKWLESHTLYTLIRNWLASMNKKASVFCHFNEVHVLNLIYSLFVKKCKYRSWSIMAKICPLLHKWFTRTQHQKNKHKKKLSAERKRKKRRESTNNHVLRYKKKMMRLARIINA